ncbi:MAG: DUF2262 domain-containing protein [Roseburia sp.]|nr:DUF2262 domain-containing protein [Roseburia sp.]
MSIRTRFESRFDEEIIDLLVLVKTRNGAHIEKNMIQPSVDFFASFNLTTGEFSPKKGILEWIIKERPDRFDWGFDFKPFEIYHIKARKKTRESIDLPKSLAYMNNCYMVVDIVEESVSHPKLDKIREKATKPVVIEDEQVGTFVLNRQDSLFYGAMEWMGRECTVLLDPDNEKENTAKKAFLHYKELHKDMETRYRQYCNYAAEELTDLANEWLEDCEDDGKTATPVTKEEFADRIRLKELSIAPEGDITLYFDDDDIFGGHSVIVEADINGEIFSADIIG